MTALLGIAVAVACLIVVEAVYTGFREQVGNQLVANSPHILVTANEPRFSPSLVSWEIKGVKNAEALSFRDGIAQSPSKTSFAKVKIGEPCKPGPCPVEVGSKLAEALGIKKGETFELIIEGRDGDPVELEFKAGQLVETGLYEQDRYYVRVDNTQIGLEAFGSFDSIALTLEEPMDSKRFADELRNDLKNNELRITDWQTVNAPLFTALEFERRIAYFVLGFILLLSAVSVSTNYLLLIRERNIDLAMLRVAGASRREISSIFLLESLAISFVGALTGVLLGIWICVIVNFAGVFELPADVYAVSKIRLRPQFWTVVLIALFSVGISLLAFLVPVYRAANVKPAEVLRR